MTQDPEDALAQEAVEGRVRIKQRRPRFTTWTKRQDDHLLDARRRGLSFGQIAPQIGKSRCAAIARFHRLTAHSFPSDLKRGCYIVNPRRGQRVKSVPIPPDAQHLGG